MPETTEKFTGWAIVEVMGHKRFAGFVSEQAIAGAALVRVDVPETVHRKQWPHQPVEVTKPGYTKLIGVGSIYCITPCDEALARRAANEIERYNDPLPVSLPVERQLPAGSSTDDAVLVPDDEEDDLSDEDDGKPF